MDKTDLCQVSIGQLESQCARGLASHEINVFTSNSSGVRVDHKLKRLKRLKRHFLDQDLKILESSCGGTLRLDPFCDWLLLAAQLLWQFPAASRSWDVLRCAEMCWGSVCSFLAPQKYLAEASVIFGQSRSESWRYNSTLPHVHTYWIYSI